MTTSKTVSIHFTFDDDVEMKLDDGNRNTEITGLATTKGIAGGSSNDHDQKMGETVNETELTITDSKKGSDQLILSDELLGILRPIVEEHLKSGVAKSDPFVICTGGHFIQPEYCSGSLVCTLCVLKGNAGTTFKNPLLYYQTILEQFQELSVTNSSGEMKDVSTQFTSDSELSLRDLIVCKKIKEDNRVEKHVHFADEIYLFPEEVKKLRETSDSRKRAWKRTAANQNANNKTAQEKWPNCSHSTPQSQWNDFRFTDEEWNQLTNAGTQNFKELESLILSWYGKTRVPYKVLIRELKRFRTSMGWKC